MRMTVRQLLHVYGYKKVGKVIEKKIRAHLERSGLRSEPDFATVNSLDQKVDIVGAANRPTDEPAIHLDNIEVIVGNLRDRVVALESTLADLRRSSD